jgi:hypothetical protein
MIAARPTVGTGEGFASGTFPIARRINIRIWFSGSARLPAPNTVMI